jgi:multidrug efflux pump subunit AcrA (membrane-fusion protein)
VLARYERSEQPATDRWTVTAPVAGVVLKVAQESETVVAPGTPLIEIADPRDLEIVVDVLSTDAVEIRSGADVTIKQPIGELMLQIRGAQRVRSASGRTVSSSLNLKAFTKLKTSAPGAIAAFAAHIGKYREDHLASFHLKRLLNGAVGLRIAVD